MDHSDIITAVSDFYTFLVTNQHLLASAIKTPPAEGWPEENREAFRKMGKSEEIVDLLCHLPYIADAKWEWLPETKPINYIDPLSLLRLNNYGSMQYLFEPSGQTLPPHVISLTNGRLYGSWFLLDIHAGTITEFSVLGGKTYEPSEEQRANGTVWLLYPTNPIREFFAACEEKMQDGASSTT